MNYKAAEKRIPQFSVIYNHAKLVLACLQMCFNTRIEVRFLYAEITHVTWDTGIRKWTAK